MVDSLKIAMKNTMKQVRLNMDPGYRLKSSQQICTRINALEPYKQAKSIALYQAVNGEVDLHEIWLKSDQMGKVCYFPVLKEDGTLLFLPATPSTPLKKNQFGISEPDVNPELAIDPDELDIVFMPLVAFDIRCRRIGMGAGYYDRTLEHKKKCALFGVAYQFQKVDHIEAQPWDVPMDAVVTQRAVYWREVQF
jgi:5-formyltetrahydrofolate cyclo-ligase